MTLILGAVIGATVLLVIGLLFIGGPTPLDSVEYGTTFSRPYARDELGLDPDAVLGAALDDLGIRRFRMGAYWQFIEPRRGDWNFEDLDRDIRAIEARGGTIVLAVGQKLPRWPECWQPAWWKELAPEEQRAETLTYLQTVVERYRDNPAIVAWQVENEPHFAYGDCPKSDATFHREEVALVRRLDPSRQIVTTDSGELSLWVTFGKTVDRLGVSVYRVVRNPLIGTWRYWFIPPSFYRRKAQFLQPFGVHSVYVSEFQMEPWNNKPLPETPLDEQFKTFDLAHMQKNLTFASRMGLSPIDLWGVEWWYWMKEKHDHPEFWEEAKRVYKP
jgi:hypothetical protein